MNRSHFFGSGFTVFISTRYDCHVVTFCFLNICELCICNSTLRVTEIRSSLIQGLRVWIFHSWFRFMNDFFGEWFTQSEFQSEPRFCSHLADRWLNQWSLQSMICERFSPVEWVSEVSESFSQLKPGGQAATFPNKQTNKQVDFTVLCRFVLCLCQYSVVWIAVNCVWFAAVCIMNLIHSARVGELVLVEMVIRFLFSVNLFLFS